MLLLSPQHFEPQVRIANHHPVPAGRAWRDRVLPDLQFILVLSGRFTYADPTGEVGVGPGEVLCIEPGVRHTYALAPGIRRGRMAGMHVELAAPGRWAEGDYRCDPLPERVTRPSDGALVSAAMLACANAWSSYDTQRAALVSASARCALVALAMGWKRTGGPAPSARARELVEHVRRHAVRGIGRSGLARAFGVSAAHVNVLFQRELGLTPTAVLNRERCAIAYRLLHEDGLSVAEAGARAGYADPFYFSRVFSRIYGFAPSRVR